MALRRKTNDLIVKTGDWVYDRKGKRYKIVRINGVVVHCVSTCKWKYHEAGDLDKWGLYTDTPYAGMQLSEDIQRKKEKFNVRRDAMARLRDYWENRDD